MGTARRAASAWMAEYEGVTHQKESNDEADEKLAVKGALQSKVEISQPKEVSPKAVKLIPPMVPISLADEFQAVQLSSQESQVEKAALFIEAPVEIPSEALPIKIKSSVSKKSTKKRISSLKKFWFPIYF